MEQDNVLRGRESPIVNFLTDGLVGRSSAPTAGNRATFKLEWKLRHEIR